MNGVILEGIPAVGKSRVLAALRERPSFQRRLSTLVLSEHYTERAVEGEEDVAAVRYQRLMYRLLAALEPLRVLSSQGRVFDNGGDKARLRYVFERFHLTNVLTHGGGNPGMLREIENAMRIYHPVTFLLVVEATEIADRLADTLPRRNDGWREFLFRHGETMADVAAYYAEQQAGYRELAGASSLPTLELDLSRLTPAEAAARVDEALGQPVGTLVEP